MIKQETIDKAILGNEEALNEIIKHYRPYIKKQSGETIRYDNGKTEHVINSELEGEIISHLLMAIIRLGDKKNGKDTSEHK